LIQLLKCSEGYKGEVELVQVLREPDMGDINQKPLIHEAMKELRQVRICYLINLLKEILGHPSVTWE